MPTPCAQIQNKAGSGMRRSARRRRFRQGCRWDLPGKTRAGGLHRRTAENEGTFRALGKRLGPKFDTRTLMTLGGALASIAALLARCQ